MRHPFNYLIEVRYLGFRFHGWARQPEVKTVQGMIERTLNYVLDGIPFKILGTSRTDAMVSALHSGFQLFLHEPLDEPDDFLRTFNANLPADIIATDIHLVSADFNIIQTPGSKEYIYSFYISESRHPFCAPFMTWLHPDTDISLMEEACSMYEGKHDYRNFTVGTPEACIRSIDYARITRNDLFTGSFFPEKSFVFTVRSSGFMRQQVRLMMGQLIKVGQHMISLDDFRRSVDGDMAIAADYAAPASGLILYKVDFRV